MTSHNSGAKRRLVDLVKRSSHNRVAWLAYDTCGRLGEYLSSIHRWAANARKDRAIQELARRLFPTLTVETGPFAGMRYIAESAGSTMLPKLLGSYESELHDTWRELMRHGYSVVVDIGSAEGYYAVGFARAFPEAHVYAYDTDSRARELCAQMAELNGVADRVHVGGFCTAETLRSLPLGDCALIISDCEAYERTLFTRDLAQYLSRHDLVIETHDFIDMEISSELRSVFTGTHKIESVKSVDDIQKVHSYNHKKLVGLSIQERYRIVRESRGGIMEWLVLVSETAAAPTSRAANSSAVLRSELR